ncbi:MAG: DUF1460 domain-containing protein [Robiginitalea sp.]
MRKFLLLGIFLFVFAYGKSQVPPLSCSPEDREIFRNMMGELQALSGDAMGATMVAVGAKFLGTPYVASTLELDGQEKLVVNFRGLDCTTFVENVLAISRLKHEGKADWESYLNTLEKIRYRQGTLQGYPSRLHYFTDWIRDNEQKGLVKDVTRQIGGVSAEKEINFMGTHPELYPALGREGNLEQIRRVETSLSINPLFVLPAKEVAKQEESLQDGDIIALATEIKGLDVTHTGIAVTGKDGRIHLLHASTEGAVMITKAPLSEYLKKIHKNTGIIVVRPMAPGRQEQ